VNVFFRIAFSCRNHPPDEHTSVQLTGSRPVWLGPLPMKGLPIWEQVLFKTRDTTCQCGDATYEVTWRVVLAVSPAGVAAGALHTSRFLTKTGA